VHETYLRLVDQCQAHWQNRSQFLGVAAQLMRRILVDHARARLAAKRGGCGSFNAGSDSRRNVGERVDLLALDGALTKLAQLNPQQARVVELRYFTGLGIEETAEALCVSPATVKREWAMARAWLKRELSEG
jgi:RNA polymerase sigma factor (TIGR02999 family)